MKIVKNNISNLKQIIVEGWLRFLDSTVNNLQTCKYNKSIYSNVAYMHTLYT